MHSRNLNCYDRPLSRLLRWSGFTNFTPTSQPPWHSCVDKEAAQRVNYPTRELSREDRLDYLPSESREEEKMKSEKESFFPNSNQVYSCRNPDNGFREEYFTQVLRKTGIQSHNIAVGDICAIRDPFDGVKSAPLKKEKWMIGQVLALFIRRVSIDQSTFHVTVRRLARWKEEGTHFAEKKTLTQFEKRGNFRPDPAL